MLLISNKNWHTAKNIEATKEFVLNYPQAEQLKDILETSQFYPAGINKLEYTTFTTMRARFVKPPLIVECYQHVECRVHNIIRPSDMQINVIADVLDISADAGLYERTRLERARMVNAPLYLGVDEERGHIFGTMGEILAESVENKLELDKKVA
jgi:flavin reductase (DIM6/NTAB) family NADH-FMN oxidoreductase RutF